ncbi:MAG: hypothetical protein ABSG74_12950 [Candidatus Bathyarchaeia archaeon]|jgi:uncharacterized membrane protein (DUF2068 family)
MAKHAARPKGVLLIAGILLFAALMVAIYWILFFSGAPALSGVPCYMTFEAAFPAADAWLAITALVGAIGLLTRKSWGVLFALLGGSASIYLGLMDVLYDILNGIYGKLSSPAGTDVAVEIAINVLTLTLGPIIIGYVWSRRQSLL